MYLSGPLTPVNAVQQIVPDASPYGGSTQAQFNNNTSYNLVVVMGGQQYLVSSYSIQTIPTNGDVRAVFTPSGILESPEGFIYVEWLQGDEQPTAQDGPLAGSSVTTNTTINPSSVVVENTSSDPVPVVVENTSSDPVPVVVENTSSDPVPVEITNGNLPPDGANFIIPAPAVQTYGAGIIPVAAGTTKTFAEVFLVTDTGTATVTILHNGAAIASYTAMAASSVVSAVAGTTVTLANGDTLQVKVTAVTGAPGFLTVTPVLITVF